MSPVDDNDVEHIRAQAAAWLARLRSNAVRPEEQTGFQVWLAEDMRHAAAFDAVTGVWDLVGGLDHARPMRYVPPSRTNRRAVLLGAALLAAGACGAGIWFVERGDSYSTAVGETRRVALADGSWITLDTDTRVTVWLRGARREIALEQGRAHFEVAPDSSRPFVVTAGIASVTAVGTAFDVRHESGALSVILEHGRVKVALGTPGSRDIDLVPGDRLISAPGEPPRLDRPDLSFLLAWRQGRLGFDGETLSSAVAEFNRYGGRPLVIGDPAIANLRISGLFSTGDSDAFARSVATLLPVAADAGPTEIVLNSAKRK
jgi:transmembrane sensor